MRLLLSLGLVLHKLVWEILKNRDTFTAGRQRSTRTPLAWLVKAGKVAALGCLVLQTLFLDLFPISSQVTSLRTLGLAIFFTGLATAIVGRLQLGKNWVDLEDYQVLPEQSLVTEGIYRYIRHPIYTGDVLLLVGLELALNSWLVILVLIPLAVFVRQSLAEEVLLSRVFPEYATYCRRTKRFIPFVL
jgi:protein-S-isoprenylcysteine O-methyltransferase Ste14